jgi:hypothetical protein
MLDSRTLADTSVHCTFGQGEYKHAQSDCQRWLMAAQRVLIVKHVKVSTVTFFGFIDVLVCRKGYVDSISTANF